MQLIQTQFNQLIMPSIFVVLLAVFSLSVAAIAEATTTAATTPNTVNSVLSEELEDTEASDDSERIPEISSSVFANPEGWYNSTEGLFTWTLPEDVEVMAMEISSSSENVPSENEDAILDSLVTEFLVTKDSVKDGVQYLSIQYKNEDGWGDVLNRKLQIDTVPPEAFSLMVQTGTLPATFPILTFVANDVTSGIDFYEVTIADRKPFRVTPDEAKFGYLLRELENGTHIIKVVAYDKAGNKYENTAPILITAGWVNPAKMVKEPLFSRYLTTINLFIFFLLLVVLLQLIYIWHAQEQIKMKEEKLRRETREVKDQMEKIFSALRDEIYDQINTITKRKRLSKSEKEAVDGLNQALEISETLIEKEINDVQAALK